MGDADYDSSDSGDDYEVPLSSQYKSKKSRNPEYTIRRALKPPRTTTYTAQSLYDQIIEGTIDLEPEYQRDIVWSDAKQIGLIDSVFRNFYIPPLIFAVSVAEDGTEKRVCIDGKQRLTSIQRFMDGEIFHKDVDTKAKYWYKKQKPTATELPVKYKRLFANKQIVCIEYSNLTDDDEREIFRRVQLGVALNAAEKMKAEQKTERQELVQRLVSDHIGTLEQLDFNTKRGTTFRWIAQAIYTTSKYPHAKASTTSAQLTKWLADPEHVDEDFAEDIQETIQLLVSVITADKECLKVTKGPTTVAPVDFVMMVVLVGRVKNKLPRNQLSRAIHMLREVARATSGDLMWKTSVIEPYLTFIVNLEEQGERILHAHHEMEVDPPNSSTGSGALGTAGRHTPTSQQTGPFRSRSTPSRTPQHLQPQDRLAAIRSAKARGAESYHPSQSLGTPVNAPQTTSHQPYSHPSQPQVSRSSTSHVDNVISQAGLGPTPSQSSPTTYAPSRADMPHGRTPPTGRGPGDRSSREGEDPRYRPYRPVDPRRDSGTTDPRLRRN
ncbi:hypothetical protein BV25DRAFT_1987816 [Artomyces pyxidatus]|uniref:Uncharacterized protein n=1 Tax=Artomyces pyxidatus TaxID=48021 RepID=A0ACB8TGA0_9AGAM|nr:hypothetical protein BV25DRAFT_1987816 [Artomyces pyxidatus]